MEGPLSAALPAAPATAPDPGGAIRIAVVIPSYRQPALLPEAIASVLDQRGAPATATVIVDDGCPFPETREVAATFAAAHPGRVFALRRPNGGLSAARNTGIDFALAAFPALEAIYFLDSDNRLHPPFLARAWAALAAAPPSVGWVYPDFDMFGQPMNGSGRGEWSLLAHLVDNLCEAGSLVRRAVFDAAGLRFDPAMRSGFEDWDFWLQAGTAGFRGQHLPASGFRYRRRPESMLAEADRQRTVLLEGLRAKHRARLFAPRRILALEAAEMPRYALHLADGTGSAVQWLLDPAEEPAEVLAPAAARARFLAAEETPAAVFHPALLAFAAPEAVDLLRDARLVRGVFWRAEAALREGRATAAAVVAVEVGRAEGAEAEVTELHGPGPVGEAAMLFVTRRLLAEAAGDTWSGWLESLRTEQPRPRLRRLRVLVPPAAPSPRAVGVPAAPQADRGPRLLRSAAPLQRLLEEAAGLREARRRRTALRAEWREEWRTPREAVAPTAYAAAAGLGAVLPWRPRPEGERAIGFVLPLFTHGGVEKVVLNQAAVLRRRGWRPHLLLLGTERAVLPPAVRETFDSVTLAAELGETDSDWRRPYFGADTAAFGGPAARNPEVSAPGAADVAGALATLDVVVNTHALGAHALMARLRRAGVRTFVGLHLLERQAWGQPIGNPHIALAYEHAYDGVLVISDQLRDWCRAQGMPAGKLHLLRNAPGHATPLAAIAAALAARAARPDGAALRVLFLGRLDPQKGMDRLAALIAATRDAPIAWRVVGRPVLEEEPPDLGVPVEPPVSDPAALDSLYAWADVLVLPSRFEGVPLVVLEAQRMGCAVVATDAGAIAEIVAHGVDGFLVPQAGGTEAMLVAAMAAQLRLLAKDRALLGAVSGRAAARVAATGWEAGMADFLEALDRLVPPPGHCGR